METSTSPTRLLTMQESTRVPLPVLWAMPAGRSSSVLTVRRMNHLAIYSSEETVLLLNQEPTYFSYTFLSRLLSHSYNNGREWP